MRAVVEGVAALHERGTCHLGVPPERIRVAADKTAKILGIGRASSLEAAGESAMVERSELGYMAAEQFDAGDVDERTDVFRLSLVLFEILTRKPALKPNSAADAREQFDDSPDADPRSAQDSALGSNNEAGEVSSGDRHNTTHSEAVS